MKEIFASLLFVSAFANAQSWPSQSWISAVNLTPVMDANGVTDLSGLHYNPVNNRLYGVQGDGHLRVLQLNATTNTFSQIANKSISGGPEGITQANLYANEFYTIDENNYEIRRYTHTSNFSSVTLYKHWNLLSAPSPMPNTGNTGPEGIVFIPDGNLIVAGFVSEQTGALYTSQKGLGGLFFVANQDQGYVWVFDVNPNANDDFIYVGKYKTNRTESCDLSFDRSTGLLYILHNIAGNNKLEVTNLSTTLTGSGNRKFVDTAEYSITNPGDGNDNIEGFAMMPKCPGTGTVSAWLCRDVESSEANAIRQDALRWFDPFIADGSCLPLSGDEFVAVQEIAIYPNPAHHEITVKGNFQNAFITIINSIGQEVLAKDNSYGNTTVDVSALPNGMYFLEIATVSGSSRIKWIKN